MELKELFEALPSVKNFDATDLDSNDLIDLLRMTGYNDKETEATISSAEDNGHFAYAGYTDRKAHKYVYAWYDEDNEEAWVAIELYVDLAKDGKVQCEFGSMPIHTFDEEDELDKFFKRVKANRKV